MKTDGIASQSVKRAPILELVPPPFRNPDAIRHPVALPVDEPLGLEAVQDSRDFGAGEKTLADEVLLKDGPAGLDDFPIEPSLVSRQ